ncbi:MAG: toll/interleukin-1 receptor domain-containing protein [Cyanobacteria bacterium J06576_12]
MEIQVSANGVHFVSLEEVEKQQKLPDAKNALAVDEHTPVLLEPLLWALQRDEEANLDIRLPDLEQDAAMALAKHAGTRLFLSYAKEDKTLVDAFVDLLSTYERDKKIQIYYDKDIHHRSGWDEQLQTEMKEAEAFVVFVSTDYFANRKEYILDEEVPLMYERHHEEKIPVFPILVNRPALLPYSGSVLKSISLLGKDLCLGDDDDPKCLNKSTEAAQKILQQLGIS